VRRLAVIPSDPIHEYLKGGYSETWLRNYYNPCQFFDEVYLLSPLEKNALDLLGMKVIHTPEEQLKHQIKNLKIDVVRAYGGNWACRMACDNKVEDVPVVVSVHDRRGHMLYESIKHADVVFCVSNVVKDLVKTKFKKLDNIRILPNRVDFDMMYPLPESQCKELNQRFPFKHKILFVGRLAKEKNPDTLIKALEILGPEYGAVFIGQGDLKGSSQCAMIGNVPHQELSRYYSWCDCMCTPSRDEGFGMVFIEALACEAVVVTSNIAPMNEFIKDGENGILVDNFEDPAHLANAIQKACTDQELRKRLKANARKSVEAFERNTIDHLEVNYYEQILLKRS
jgi:glycosyltransferase involved in cell wall biosynthesis